MSAPASRLRLNRRTLLRAGAGMAGILATGRAPALAQTHPKKLVFAHINAVPESAAVAFDWMAKELTARSNGELEMQFFGKTLIPQELEIMNAVKSGSIAMGSPAGAAATVFPEMGALLVPYLVKDYTSAYAMLNGRIGDKISSEIEDKYKLKVLCYFDYGFRHFWTSKKPIIEPRDLRGLKIRELYDAGVDVKMIARWQGHRDGGRLIQSTYTEIFRSSDADYERQQLAKANGKIIPFAAEKAA